jgi:hypothetical protein
VEAACKRNSNLNPITDPAISTTSTSSTLPISTSLISVPPSGKVVTGCPGLGGTLQRSIVGSTSWNFQIKCQGDFLGRTNAEIDIMAMRAYTFNDCLKACATYNKQKGSNACRAVAFNADLEYTGNGNCYIKNGTGNEIISGSKDNISGKLITDA